LHEPAVDDKQNATPNADRYLESRAKFRERARSTFYAAEPESTALLATAHELVSGLTFFLSGRDLSGIPNGLYLGDLIVSFCRSHFIAADLLQNAELVECAVILRKQIELLARIVELQTTDVSSLEGKTPNIRGLQQLVRRLYPEYSSISHSASSTTIQLLGHYLGDDVVRTPLFPEFGRNAYVALNHLGILAAEFFLAVRGLYTGHFAEYFPDPDVETFDRLVSHLRSERLRAAAGELAMGTVERQPDA
jgi:hypothetical protein